MRSAVSMAVAVLFCSSATALAQLQLPRVDEIVEVRIINFDVVVTDARGNHVPGLTRDDFELLEDGQKQEITNFSEYRQEDTPVAGVPPGTVAEETPGPPRRIVIFVDVVTTSTFERKRAAKALTTFVNGLQPDDEVMLVSWNRRLKVNVPLTRDRAAVSDAIDTVSRELVANSLELAMQDRGRATGAELRTLTRVQARRALVDLQHTVGAVNAVITRLSGLDGRKALILLTKGFAARMYDDAEEVPTEELDAARTLVHLERTASAAGVTLYGVHAGGLDSGVSVEDSADMTKARTRSSSASIDGLRHLAFETGGLVASNTNFFQTAFEAIAADLESYYSLGYRASTRRVRGQKNVEIRTRDKTLRVRARRSLIERTLDEEIAERVVSHLFFPVTGNDLGITAAVASADRQKRNRYAVAVDVSVPYSVLAFTPEGNDLVADLSFFIGSADARGSLSDVKRFDQKVRVARDRLASVATQQYNYGFDVDLRTIAGEHRISVAVVDHVSRGTGYAMVDLGTLPRK